MTAHALKEQDYAQDNAAPAESAEQKRRRIASQAEAACKDSVDFEEFTSRYKIGFSDFV